ncbi:hypothetical protein [Streptomyces lavendulocolor]|uniref:hypothetical protein n=1 Tax=Streptomyces lavendulocolor TaxID=67316 RepID=UPI0033C8D129
MRSIALRYLQLNDEITELDRHLNRLVTQAVAELMAVKGLGAETVAALLIAVGDNPNGSAPNRPSPTSAASPPSQPPPAKPAATGSTAEATGKPITPST